MNAYEKINSILVTEFDRYIMEHPEFAAKIPRNAQVILQKEDDSSYNRWVKQLAESQRENGQPVVYVCIKRLKPVRSRLTEPLLQESVA